MADYGQMLIKGLKEGGIQKSEMMALAAYWENAADDQGKTPLHLAASNGDAELVRAIGDQGASAVAVDSEGNNPLHEACVWGQEECAALLVWYFPTLDDVRRLKNSEGLTAMEAAFGADPSGFKPVVKSEINANGTFAFVEVPSQTLCARDRD